MVLVLCICPDDAFYFEKSFMKISKRVFSELFSGQDFQNN